MILIGKSLSQKHRTQNSKGKTHNNKTHKSKHRSHKLWTQNTKHLYTKHDVTYRLLLYILCFVCRYFEFCVHNLCLLCFDFWVSCFKFSLLCSVLYVLRTVIFSLEGAIKRFSANVRMPRWRKKECRETKTGISIMLHFMQLAHLRHIDINVQN